jgi:hypothetical protein
VVLWSARSVRGIESPDWLKPLPDAEIFVTVKSPVPVFVRRIVWLSVVPTVTFPKLTEDGVTLAAGEFPPSAGPPVAVLPVTPTQAAVLSKPTMTRTSENTRSSDARSCGLGRADAGSRLPPSMWTPLMTRLDCQTMRMFRATGQKYTVGTGGCTCPRGQPVVDLLGRLDVPAR